MRLNRYIAQATGLSRRAADAAISAGRVLVDGQPPQLGQPVQPGQQVTLDGQKLSAQTTTQTIMLNKPAGYVCSRDGQGSKTIYDLLPETYHHLKPVGRLDKDSSGLLLLTSDGDLAHKLTHPSFQKAKVYGIRLNHTLSPADFETITKTGVPLEDGLSKLGLDPANNSNTQWRITMHEGRNRQIRRTFETLGYRVKTLHRTHFGPYALGTLASGRYKACAP